MNPITLTLTASAQLAPAPAAPAAATAAGGRHLTASAESRQIIGPVVEYGAIGYASTGQTIFEHGSLDFDPAFIKFLLMHDMERPLGTMAGIDHSNPGMPVGTFQVAAGQLGDEALEMAADGRRDGLSVGVLIHDYEWRESDGVLVVKAGRVTEVSLVTIPAFQNALVSTVSASLKGTDMTKQTMLAPVPLTASAAAPELPAEAAQTPQPSQQTAPTAAPQAAAAAASTPQGPAPVAATARQAPPVLVTERPSADLDTVAARIAGHFSAGGNGSNLTAALTDVLIADDAAGATTASPVRGQWVDELWQATRTERPTIDSLGTPRDLRSLKVKGWKRVYPATPMVNEYAGNKTEIPASGKITTAPEEATAQRWAGGWDIDRAYIDFNDEQMVRANLEAATDDYKQQTEADVVAKFLAAATIVPNAPTLTGALSQLGLRAGALGARLSIIQFGADAWSDFLDMKTADVPWWLQKQGDINLSDAGGSAGGLRFTVNQELPADTIEAHDSRAATFYEKNPPVQVQALDISRAGVDLGVYGYTALLINDERAIFRTAVGAAV